MAGKGKAFETLIQQKCELYCAQSVAYIEKVDPPCKIIGTGANRRVIFLDNPFLDFTGVVFGVPYSQRVDFEAKETQGDRLPFRRHGGLTENQWQAMKKWHDFGSDVFLLWYKTGEVRKIPTVELFGAEYDEAKSLKWGIGDLVVDMNFLEVK